MNSLTLHISYDDGTISEPGVLAGWAYENWLQDNYGVEEETHIEIDEEEEEIESFDIDSLKPGINLHKIKIADWKVRN